MKYIYLFIMFIVTPVFIFGIDINMNGITHELIEKFANLLPLHLAIIIFGAYIGKKIAAYCKLPAVIGMLFMGMLCGPFALGSIPIPLFPEGLIPHFPSHFGIPPTIHDFANLATIILLFLAGLETDFPLFLQYALKSSIVGIIEALGTFVIILYIASQLFGLTFNDPIILFIAAAATATSVGVSASILSDKKKIASPEGVIILAAGVLDDVLGIIILAIATGIASMSVSGAEFSIQAIEILALKDISIWLAATVVCILVARVVSRLIKKVSGSEYNISLIILGLALLLGGLFQQWGLSMVIGAYVIGLAFSYTELAYMIEERMMMLKKFFVPMFFFISGMALDVSILLDIHIVLTGLLLGLIAIFTKIICAGGASLLLKFNIIGALRIGIGMAPRGEVTLIIAGIGLSRGFINAEHFASIMIMTIITMIIPPLFFSHMLDIKKTGTKLTDSRRDEDMIYHTVRTYSLYSARIILDYLIVRLREEKYFTTYVHGQDLPQYQVRKNNIFVSICITPEHQLLFHGSIYGVTIIQLIFYDAFREFGKQLLEIGSVKAHKILNIKPIVYEDFQKRYRIKFMPFIRRSYIATLQSTTIYDAFRELHGVMAQSADPMSHWLIADFLQSTIEAIDKNEFMDNIIILERGIVIHYYKVSHIPTRVAIGIAAQGINTQKNNNSAHIIIQVLINEDYFEAHSFVLIAILSYFTEERIRESIAMEADELYMAIKIAQKRVLSEPSAFNMAMKLLQDNMHERIQERLPEDFDVQVLHTDEHKHNDAKDDNRE